MPRYHFDFRQDGHLTSDIVGCAFPNIEEAYLEAFKAARETWVELLHQRRDPRRCAFEIHDGQGNLLFVLPFWEVLESCHDYPRAKSNLLETFRESMQAIRHVRRAHLEFSEEMERARQTLCESGKLIASAAMVS